jgi:hypothetical protein
VKNPVSLKATGGIYLNRQNYVGGTVEYAIIDDSKTYFGFGGRYCYHYDAGTKNTAFYIPIELKYNFRRFNVKYDVFDSYDPIFQTSITKDWEADISYQATTISLGHGFSFIKLNKRSIAIELSMFAQIIPSVKYHNEFPFSNPPSSTFDGAKGVRASLLFNL